MKLIKACKENKKCVKMIEQAIRTCFRYSVTYVDALDKALSPKKGARGGKRYICASCKNDMMLPRYVQLDHISPVVPLDKSLEDMSIDELYSRIMCDLDNLQVLCLVCHKDKCKIEARQRAEYRRLKKELISDESEE